MCRLAACGFPCLAFALAYLRDGVQIGRLPFRIELALCCKEISPIPFYPEAFYEFQHHASAAHGAFGFGVTLEYVDDPLCDGLIDNVLVTHNLNIAITDGCLLNGRGDFFSGIRT